MGNSKSIEFWSEIYNKQSLEYVDLSQAVTGSGVTAYNLSGLKIISETIEEHIKDIADGVFIEYNLLGSVLDSHIVGDRKLCSFTYVRQNNYAPDFTANMRKYTTAIIDALYDYDFTLFHHPDLFIDAKTPKVVYSIINSNEECIINPQVEELIRSKVSSEDTPLVNIVRETSLFSTATPTSDWSIPSENIPFANTTTHKVYVGNFQFGRDYDYTRQLAQRIRREKRIALEQAVEEFHNYYHKFITNYSSQQNQASVLMTIPIFGANSHSKDPYASERHIQGQSIIFLYFTVNPKKENEINMIAPTIATDLYKKIGDQIRFFAINYLFSLGLRLHSQSRLESIKSAKAAIMSRNMSHNLGSHVMFYIKQKLQSVSKIVNNNVLHNIIPGNLEDINIKTITDKIAANKDVELPFLVGLGRFINYLQERQDYIATVATNYIPARSTISFKDFIYDELKPDLRHKRHHPSGDGTDAGWQPSNLLLDYIAYSEGYSKSDAIEIKFGEFDGLNSHDASAKDDFQALRKFNVAVPGGVIGRQAIFSIVENIIRNAAKHSEHRPDGKLVLQLSLVDAEDDFTGDLLTDKFRCKRKEMGSVESGESLVKLYQNHKDTFHILRIKLDMPNKEDDIEALVGKLGEDYVEEDGSMKETSKGLKEMRISAAWLRGHSIDTAIPTTEPPVLAVYSEPYKGDKDKETISYYLCIPKPCKVAFVVEDMAKYTALNDEIKPFGCQIFEYVEQNEKNQDNKEAVRTFRNQIADYEIVCMDLEEGKGGCILPYISSRYITNSATAKSILDELERIAKPSKGSGQEGKNNETQYAQIKTAIDSIYEKWFEETYGKVNNKLLIADDKTCEKHQTRNVKEVASQNNTANDLGVILRATGTAKKEDCENSVIYSTHFAGLYKAHCSTNDKDATKSGYELLQSGASIEAITGNNSTDRLIRQDEWNKEWKYKHLSAGLARVAIFDERIFGSFITKSQVASTIDSKEVNDIIDIHNTNNMSVEDFTDKLQSKGVGEDDAYNIFYNSDDSEVITNILSNYTSATYSCQLAQKNYERRIWAFNINIDEQKKSVNIMGYDANIGNYPDWADANESKPPIVVATLNATGEEYHVTLSPDGKRIFPKEGNNCNSHIFDYITIHQGILDKIYGAFGIKDNDAAKLEVTKAIHSCFSKHNTDNTDATDFLPNFIIHSGRSKPNEKDMPQRQPFVQFAAVDHAVKDCKHTLVELLATAHYE